MPKLFSCHAVSLRVKNVYFPFDLHSAAAYDSQLPCHANAMLWPCRSSQGHGADTAVKRQPVGYLPAFCFFRLPRGVPRRSLSEAYQSSSQRSIPTTVKSGHSTAGARHGHGTASVNQTRLHCVNETGKTHSKPLAARHTTCELALRQLQNTPRQAFT